MAGQSPINATSGLMCSFLSRDGLDVAWDSPIFAGVGSLTGSLYIVSLANVRMIERNVDSAQTLASA